MLIVMTEEGSLYRATLTELKLGKHTFFRGWYCETGEHSVSIKVTGKIKYTTCRQPASSKICEIRNCWCGPDVNIPKAIDKQTLEVFRNKVKNNTKPYGKRTLGNIVAVGQLEKIQQSNFNIDWNILKRCNYDCSYCPPRIHDNHSPYPDMDNLKSIYNSLDIPDRDVTITLTGGEPTMWNELLDFILWLKAQRPSEVEILTNGTASIDRLISLHAESALVISLHHEYHSDKLFDKLAQFLEETPYTNRVSFKTFEYGSTADFYSRIQHHSFVRLGNEIPIVNKDTAVWDFENADSKN